MRNPISNRLRLTPQGFGVPEPDEFDGRPERVRLASKDPRHVDFDKFEIIPIPGRASHWRHVDTGREYRRKSGAAQLGAAIDGGKEDVIVTAHDERYDEWEVIHLTPVDKTVEDIKQRQADTANRWASQRQTRVAEAQASARPVDAAMLAGSPQPITVRSAAQTITNAGGTITVDGTALVIGVPASGMELAGTSRRKLVWCAKVLYAAHAEVVKAAKAGKLAGLPDQTVTPAGHLI